MKLPLGIVHLSYLASHLADAVLCHPPQKDRMEELRPACEVVVKKISAPLIDTFASMLKQAAKHIRRSCFCFHARESVATWGREAIVAFDLLVRKWFA